MSNVTYINEELREIAARLPKSYATRWSAERKAAVVRAVHARAISIRNALRTYRLSVEEFRSWQDEFAARGVTGLRARALVAAHR